MRDATGKFLLVSPRGEPVRVLIDGSLRTLPDPRRSGGSGPTICDMDGDGENEIVATLADPDGSRSARSSMPGAG